MQNTCLALPLRGQSSELSSGGACHLAQVKALGLTLSCGWPNVQGTREVSPSASGGNEGDSHVYPCHLVLSGLAQPASRKGTDL